MLKTVVAVCLLFCVHFPRVSEQQSPFVGRVPGAVVRVTSKGLWRFQAMLQEAMITTMKEAKPRSIFDAILNDRFVNFTDIIVDTVKKPIKMDIRYLPNAVTPIVMNITDLNMKVAMKAQMNFRRAKVGDFTVELKDMNLQTGTRLTTDGQGHLQVQMTHCWTDIRRVKFMFASKKLVLVNTKNMHETVHRVLVSKICPNLQGPGIASLNNELRKIPTTIKLFQPYEEQRRRDASPSSKRRYGGPMLDLGLTADPIIRYSPPTIDLPLKADVLPPRPYRGATLQGPPDTQIYDPAKDVNVFISNQPISALYHSFYSNGLMRRTRLENGFMKFCKQIGNSCIGKINDALAKKYRGQSLIFKMKPTAVPSVSIHNALAKFHDQYTVTLFPTKDRVTLMSGRLSADVTSDFSGNYEPRITNFKFTPTSNALKYSPEEMRNVTEAVRNTYKEFLSSMLRNSFALPKFPYFNMVNLQTTPTPNGLRMAFDVQYNSETMYPIMSQVFSDIITF